MKSPKFTAALKVGILFGFIEAITPVLGWLLGLVAVNYIEQWDHWVILVIMLFLGVRMIRNSLSDDACCADDLVDKKDSLFILVLTAISTSIDSFAVGISLGLATVNIGLAALLIGLATCLMVTIGILLGKRLSQYIGKRAEFIGGCVLIGIGFWTVYQHIGVSTVLH